MAAVEFTEVCFGYGEGEEEVLHDITLTLPDKSLVAVVGPNGGGKTTLMRLTLGLLKPRRGTVSVFGAAPQKQRRRIGYVPQHLSYDHAFPVSVLDVVLMGRVDRHPFGPHRSADKEQAMAALEQVQLTHLRRRSLSRLSGGERQRVLIAQALVTQPDLLLLDEPTANVDAASETEIYDILHRLNEEMTIVVVSHNLNVVTRHASHIACVNRTATLSPMEAFTGGIPGELLESDMAVLRHAMECQILSPGDAPCHHEEMQP